MRILFSSHVFAPSVGGIETASQTLAAELVRRGHEVRLITQTPAASPDDYPFAVWRRPSARSLFRQVRWCDLYFHNNISLPRVWPLLAIRRPWVVAHHVWIPRTGLGGRCKRLALRFATGIAVSAAIAEDFSTRSIVIPNAYDDSVFRRLPDIQRDRDIVYVGRLVSDKGAGVLVAALARLAAEGRRPTVTIVGQGPEEYALRQQVAECGLGGTVRFAGMLQGHELARTLNAHRIITIPSVWREPFGIVALEGIACGCIPVGSAGGGLASAIGECGATFPSGDAPALARVLTRLLSDDALQSEYRAHAAEHLHRHTRAHVADAYLTIFERVCGGGQRIGSEAGLTH